MLPSPLVDEEDHRLQRGKTVSIPYPSCKSNKTYVVVVGIRSFFGKEDDAEAAAGRSRRRKSIVFVEDWTEDALLAKLKTTEQTKGK